MKSRVRYFTLISLIVLFVSESVEELYPKLLRAKILQTRISLQVNIDGELFDELFVPVTNGNLGYMGCSCYITLSSLFTC